MAPQIIFFDLETTGLKPPSAHEPVMIGAIDSWGEHEYKGFLIPNRNIHDRASEINGFRKSGECLYRNNELITDAMLLKDGLYDFLSWLESFGEKVILVAHNCFDFDAMVLTSSFNKFGIEYEDVIFGFSDSLVACQNMYVDEHRHNLLAMLEKVDGQIEAHHDALEDAKACRTIVRRTARKFQHPFVRFVRNPLWFRNVDSIYSN